MFLRTSHQHLVDCQTLKNITDPYAVLLSDTLYRQLIAVLPISSLSVSAHCPITDLEKQSSAPMSLQSHLRQ